MEYVLMSVPVSKVLHSMFLQYCAEHNLKFDDLHEAGIYIRVFSDFVMECLKDEFETDEEETDD